MNKYINNFYKGVKGITVIDSEKPGKNVGIFAITHGNEPVGLEVFDYLENDFNIKNNILSGKIYLIAINIKAYEKYILQDNYLNYRFIDNNMNRIYKKDFINNSVEFERFNELKNIFDEIDIAIDLHSVPKGDDIIGITDKKYLDIAKIFFDVENILVDDIGKTGAMIGYFIDNGKIAFGIECGNHIGKDAYKNGVTNVLNMLGYFGFIEYKFTKDNILKGIFKFLKEIIPKTINFKYSKNYNNFEKIDSNEIYATDLDIIYKNNLNKGIYIALVGKKVKLGDGNGFLFEKID